MIQRPHSPLHPFSWPLWVKFAVFVTLALVVLMAVAFQSVVGGINEVSLNNTRLLFAETGARRVVAINDAIERADTFFTTYADNPVTERLVVSVLIGQIETSGDFGVPPVAPTVLNADLRANLLQASAGSIDSARVLDRNGVIVASTSANVGIDQSGSPTYSAAISAQLQGIDDTFILYQDGNFSVIELIRIVRWRNDAPIGYLVARLSNNAVIQTYLQRTPIEIEMNAFSFIVSTQGVIVTSPESVALAREASRSPLVPRALAGQSGIDTYTRDEVERLVYYANIGGVAALITEATVADAVGAAQAGRFFNVSAFVVGIGSIAAAILLVLIFTTLIAPPIERLRQAALTMSSGDFNVTLPDARRGDSLGALANSVGVLRDQLSGLIDDLQKRIAERQRDIEATQDISRAIVAQQSLQELMDGVITLILDRFPNIYHAQVFLIDPENQYALLRASTNEPGRRLLERGHRLAVGSVSVIGQVTAQARVIVARDASTSDVHRRNEFLPDTRAELAVPLRVGDRVIGALDVQSKEADAFPDDQVSVLETLAAQVAIAIENSRLYEEAARRTIEIEQRNRRATLQAWEDFLRERRTEALTRAVGTVTPTDMSLLRRRAIATGRIAVGTPTERRTVVIAVPVILRGQVLGAVEWELPQRGMSEDRIELARALADRLAVSLDNARLFQESQRAAERERVVNEIATKLTAQSRVDDILQTAVREVGQALRVPQVTIRVRPEANEDGNYLIGGGANGAPTNGFHKNGASTSNDDAANTSNGNH